MRVKLSQIPFVRLLLPFATGIVAELYYSSHWWLICAGILSLCLLFLWNWQERVKGASYNLRWINGTFITICLFSAGYCTMLLRTPSENKRYVGNEIEGSKDSMLVTLVSIPQEKQKTYKAIGEVNSIIKHGKQYNTTGKVLLYFHRDSLVKKLNYGEQLFIYAQLKQPLPPLNPDEFDYRQYLQWHEINYEGYISTYHILGVNGSSILRFANNSRKKLSNLLHQKMDSANADIASAILLGYRDDLSPPVVQSFVDSGVVHVICVAGLHVGILFLLLNYIVVFPLRFRYSRLWSVLIILFLLWLYALFTGLAVPVLRATIMFSFLTIGKHFRRYTNSINFLAASAFLILLFNPFSIVDAGFQLSYIAVLGILVIYQPLFSLFEPANTIIHKLWELACVSVAAQIAVLPLSLFYFHQFPNYFILANILVVPLLVVVIYTGILFFLTSYIPIISNGITWVLIKCISLINLIVSGVAHLPYSTFRGISISLIEVLILFLFIISFILFFFSRKKYFFISGLFILILFLVMRTEEKIIHRHQQKIIVYNVPGKSALAFISGENSLMPFSTIDSNDVVYYLQNNRRRLGIVNNVFIHNDTNATMLRDKLLIQSQYMQFNQYRVAYMQQYDILPDSGHKITLHCIIISGSYELDMLHLKNAFNFDILIFDSSVPERKLKQWEEECRKLNLPYYSVGMQGAYIENC